MVITKWEKIGQLSESSNTTDWCIDMTTDFKDGKRQIGLKKIKSIKFTDRDDAINEEYKETILEILSNKESSSSVIVPTLQLNNNDISNLSISSIDRYFNIDNSESLVIDTLEKICVRYGVRLIWIDYMIDRKIPTYNDFVFTCDSCREPDCMRVLLDLTDFIRTLFNAKHYYGQIGIIAEIVKNMKCMEKDGELRRMNIVEVDNIFHEAKLKLTI